jgi:hypothetical protein
MSLSKSRFVPGVQRLKRLYRQVHSPELSAEQNDCPAAILGQGLKPGGLAARQAFLGGVQKERGRDTI